MQCQIISIGNELLTGDTENTNAVWLGERLTEAGVEVTYIHTIADDRAVIKKVVDSALSAAGLVITTGGLGPTADDVTKKAVTELFGAKEVLHRPTLEFIKKRFQKRGIPFSKSNVHQAEVPDCCEVLFNRRGTAPGMWFERGKSRLAVLPGIPHEMKHLMEKYIIPRIGGINGKTKVHHSHYLITAGVGESTLSDAIIGDLEPVTDRHVQVAWLPDTQGEKIRITARASSEKEAREKISKVVDFIKEKAGYVIIGEGREVTLPEVLGKLLSEKKKSLAIAESCTGGFISNMITNIPGSSRYMKGGIVAYSNKVKIKALGVKRQTIEEHGAVSMAAAVEMAEGVAKKLEADIGISTTGIAGPGGGSEEKPVGLVWIGFFSKDFHFALKARFSEDRLINKERTSAVVLETVRRCLLNIEEMPYGLKKYTA